MDERALRQTKESLFLCIAVAGLLFVTFAVFAIASPPSTTFDFVVELVMSVGLSILLKVFVWTFAGRGVATTVGVAWLVGFGLVAALVDFPTADGTTWCVVELIVTLVLMLVGALQSVVQMRELSERARAFLGATLALAFVAAMAIVVATSTQSRWNLLFAGFAVLGIVVAIAAVKVSHAKPDAEETHSSTSATHDTPSSGAVEDIDMDLFRKHAMEHLRREGRLPYRMYAHNR